MTQAKLKKIFYSNGKLLITGEYTVLDGAVALALPTIGGQYLEITPVEGNTINWTSFDADGSVWYESNFTIDAVIKNSQQQDEITNKLIEILHEAWIVNPNIFSNNAGFEVTTKLTFLKHWGLGTSSTLINNIAQWFTIDAYVLQSKTFGSSGYDIACAQHNTPLLYNLDEGHPITQPIHFNPVFADNLYFVYLNRKQNSRQAIAAYRERRNSIAPVIANINSLTDKAINTNSLVDFCTILKDHESIMSEVLGLPTVQSLIFPDFNGTIKSLGAWGGDFVLAASEENPEDYFKSKGFETIIKYSNMSLQ